MAEFAGVGIPDHMARRLHELTHRSRAVATARGAALTLAALLVCMLTVVAIDLFVPMLVPPAAMLLTPLTRIILTSTGLAVTGVVALFTLVLPLRRHPSLTQAAFALEKSRPDMQERVSTTVELAISGDPEHLRGSRQMIEQVARSGDAAADAVSVRQVVAAAPARRAWVWAGSILLLIVAGAAVSPNVFGLYLRRAVEPWNETAQFRRTRVESLTGHRDVPRMEPLTIEARSSGLRAAQATIYIAYANTEGGVRRRSFSVPAEDRDGQTLFHFAIPHVQESFSYRIRANDGVTEPCFVTAVDRPQVERLDLSCHYPAYTGRPTRDEPNSTGAVKAVAHTRVAVTVRTNRDVDPDRSALVVHTQSSAQTQPEERRTPLSRVGDRLYAAEFEVLANGSYHVHLHAAGLDSLLTADRRHGIVAEVDAAPWVRVVSPAGEVRMRPDDKLPIGCQTGDDFGVSQAVIAYSIDGGKWEKTPASQPERVGDAYRWQPALALADIGIRKDAGFRVDWQVQVADNLPAEFGGPQWTSSSRMRIVIDSSASDYQDRLAKTLREAFADDVRKLEKELKDALADVQAVKKAMADQPLMDFAQGKQTDSAIDHMAKANELAMTAGGKTEFSNYERMGKRLAEIAIGHIQPAKAAAGQSKELAEQADPRKAKLTQCQWHIEQALAKLNEVSQEFTDLIKAEQKAERLEDLARKQDDLADKMAKDTADVNELRRMAAEQAALLEQARKMLRAGKEEATEPLFDIARKAEQTLNEKIDEVANRQKDLIRESDQAGKLGELTQRAKDLAQQQKQLGQQAAAFEKSQADRLAKADAPRESSPKMNDAAGQIERGELKDAVRNQQAATTQLDDASKQMAAHADRTAASQPDAAAQRTEAAQMKQMAQAARELEARQKELAAKTAQQADAVQQARAKADAVGEQAKSASDDLARKQADLAAKFDQLRKEADANLKPDEAKAAGATDPTDQASKSSEQLKQQNPAQAAAPAAKAAQQAKQLAEAMKKAADARPADASSPDAGKDAAVRELAEKANRLADAQADVSRQVADAQQKQAAADKARADAAASTKPRSDELARRQAAVAEQAKSLQDQIAKSSNPDAKAAAQQHDAAKPAADAAAKLAGEPRAAAPDQAKAAEQLGQIAKALDDAAKPAAAKAAQAEDAARQAAADRNAAAQADAMKARQEQLAKDTQKLAQDMEQAKSDLAAKQLADVAAKQQALAEKAADLADNVARQPADEQGNPQPAKPNDAATEGAAAAKAAGQQLEQGKLGDAQAQQQQAAGKLDKLAGDLAKQAGAPGSDAAQQQVAQGQAQAAAKLAQEQKQLADEVANLVKKDPLANLPAKQEALREETRDLGEQAKMVADFLRDASPAAGELARQAAAELGQQAPANQDAAAKAMGQGQMPAAKAAQQAAAQNMQKAKDLFDQAANEAAKAAQAAADAQAGQAADAQPQDPDAQAAGKSEEMNPYDPLATAAWAQAQAKAMMQAAAAQQAAQAQQGQQGQQAQSAMAQAQAAQQAAQAAQGLAQAAQQMAQAAQAMSLASMGKSMQPGQQTKLYAPAMESKFGSMGGDAETRKLGLDLSMTTSEWNRLPGWLQQEIVQAAKEKPPQEYRELIKRYFQAVSQQTGQK